MTQVQDFSASSPLAGPALRLPILAAVNRALLLGIDILLEWQRRARTRHELALLSDFDLKDVGLSRADIVKEADKPFWRP